MFGGEGAAGTEAQSVGEIGRSEGSEWAEAVNGTLECERPHCRPRGTERRRGARGGVGSSLCCSRGPL